MSPLSETSLIQKKPVSARRIQMAGPPFELIVRLPTDPSVKHLQLSNTKDVTMWKWNRLPFLGGEVFQVRPSFSSNLVAFSCSLNSETHTHTGSIQGLQPRKDRLSRKRLAKIQISHSTKQQNRHLLLLTRQKAPLFLLLFYTGERIPDKRV